MPSEIAGITICQLPHPTRPGELCGARFAGPAHIVLGQNGASRMMALLEKLITHLSVDHQEYVKNAMLQGEEFKGLLYMMAFQSADPEFQKQRNHFRWSVHQQTLNAKITDEQLKGAADQLARKICDDIMFWIESDRVGFVRAMITQRLEPELTILRDALQEPVEPPNPVAPTVTA